MEDKKKGKMLRTMGTYNNKERNNSKTHMRVKERVINISDIEES